MITPSYPDHQPQIRSRPTRPHQNITCLSRVRTDGTSRRCPSKFTFLLTSLSLVWFSPLSTSQLTTFGCNGSSSNIIFAEAFVTTSKISVNIPIMNNNELYRSCGNGECQPIGTMSSFRTTHSLHKTTLFSNSYHLKELDGTNRKHSLKQPQPQQQQLLQPLSKSHQTELFKTYSEYCRIQSILQKPTDDMQQPHSLQPHADEIIQIQAEKCGYDHEKLTEFKNILSQGPIARETLFLHNIRLVHYVVNSLLSSPLPPSTSDTSPTPHTGGNKDNTYMTTHLSKDDLLQEGVIGLSRAIDKFNPDLNYAFSTYAIHWIKAGVRRCIYSGDELIRVPEHVSTAVRKLNKALMNGAIDSKIVSQKTGLTANMVREAAVVKERRQWSKRSGGYLALEDWMVSETSQNSAKLHYEDGDYTTGLDGLEREGTIQQLKETISPFLSMKEMQALSWRYGLLKEEQAMFRDYENEAEEDLFGPTGILSISDVEADLNMKVTTTNINPTVAPTGRRRKSLLAAKTDDHGKTRSNTNMNKEKKGGRWGEAMSFAEVAKQMCISGGYGRRLCSSALKKLTKAAEEGQLDPALFY